MYLTKPAGWPRWVKILTGLVAVTSLAFALGLAALIKWPQLAAQNIDTLRNLIGDAPVAAIESTLLGIQDHAQQLGYQAGVVRPDSPWADDPLASPTPAATVKVDLPTPIAIPTNPAIDTPQVASAPVVAAAWQPRTVAPLGSLKGEAQWTAYLYDANGQAVADRTFFQPDPQRPYAVAAVVAFNLQATHLHFVLGTQEPQPFTPQNPALRPGTIAAPDFQPGIVLAAFNGGFKARHGYYGAMADGLTALPPIMNMGTVAIYKNGQVVIGEWGKDIQDSPNLLAWRQNGEMLIHNGEVNPDTAQTNTDWGLTVGGAAITWRSALGLSPDGHTLYYVAGPSLDVATLTRVMSQLGAQQALELDVNNFWVNFVAIHGKGASFTADPLLKGMNGQPDRYFKPNPRDFFYVTAQ